MTHIMTRILIFFGVFTLVLGGALPVAAQTSPQTYKFVTCSNNNATNVSIGQAQLSVIVTDVGGGMIKFRFENAGPNVSSIARIYFDDYPQPADRLLVTPMQITDSGAGVSFSQGGSPGNLPSANTCPDIDKDGVLQFSADHRATANPPPSNSGVNPGEWIEITMGLANGFTYANAITGLNTGYLRIGIHVIAFANGGSETFVSQPPDPETYIRLASFDIERAAGSAVIRWETAVETDNAGFNLYRASAINGQFVKINDQLIAAAGNGTGASYSYIDAVGPGNYYYLLEDIDTSGVATQHIPVSAAAEPGPNRIFLPLIGVAQ
jgi:hypothetical protein